MIIKRTGWKSEWVSRGSEAVSAMFIVLFIIIGIAGVMGFIIALLDYTIFHRHLEWVVVSLQSIALSLVGLFWLDRDRSRS